MRRGCGRWRCCGSVARIGVGGAATARRPETQGRQRMLPIEIRMLACSATLCLLLAVPYTLGLLLERGLPTMVGNREDFPAGRGWIGRSRRAHLNMVENLL